MSSTIQNSQPNGVTLSQNIYTSQGNTQQMPSQHIPYMGYQQHPMMQHMGLQNMQYNHPYQNMLLSNQNVQYMPSYQNMQGEQMLTGAEYPNENVYEGEEENEASYEDDDDVDRGMVVNEVQRKITLSGDKDLYCVFFCLLKDT